MDKKRKAVAHVLLAYAYVWAANEKLKNREWSCGCMAALQRQLVGAQRDMELAVETLIGPEWRKDSMACVAAKRQIREEDMIDEDS